MTRVFLTEKELLARLGTMLGTHTLLWLVLFAILGCREPAKKEPTSQTMPEGSSPAGTEGNVFRLGTEEKAPKKRGADGEEGSVRIKLKRDPKDSYSWELSGNNPRDVLKVDKLLRRELLPKQSGAEGR